MTAKIINIASAKASRIASGIVTSNTSSQPEWSYQLYKENFDAEYEALISNQNTRQHKYKFPTVLADYRKDINPIDALYQNLQESLFKYDADNEFCLWVVTLFKDEEWLAQLITDIESDCRNITEFQNEHIKNDMNIGLSKLHVLQNIKSNFQHYIEVFSLMKDWQK